MSDSELLTPNSLPIPRDRLRNFWYVPPAHGSDTVFVFLHGINSDSRSCWLHADRLPERRVFWPDLVRNDSRLGHPSIYMAGYLTNPEAGRYGIADCAQEVLHALEAPDPGGWPPVIASPRIAFICHSTGGIVARYMIERWDEKFRDHPIGLALIASPSLGSRWANLLSPAFWVYNQRLGLQLRSNDPVLADLHRRFRDLPGKVPVFGMEACEHKMILRRGIPRLVRWLIPPRLTIVSQLSAGQYFRDVTVLGETDHFSAVKPPSMVHPAHQFLVRFATDFRKHADQRTRTPLLDGPLPGGQAGVELTQGERRPTVDGAGRPADSSGGEEEERANRIIVDYVHRC